MLDELARPHAGERKPMEEVELGELVREIVEAPPFSDRGPSVILRAGAVTVLADRGRLGKCVGAPQHGGDDEGAQRHGALRYHSARSAFCCTRESSVR